MRFDSADVSEVMAKVRSAGCGGGSVTIPLKESVLPEMDELSESARIIGAVNTITKDPDGKLKGDNTDWLGIKNQLESRLPTPQPANLVCLLCGSGGTARAAAFALKAMGASRVLIYNRTAARAEALANEFGFEACPDLDALEDLQVLHIVVNTLPGSTDFVLPEGPAKLAIRRPVVLEAAYIPRRTVFAQQALDAGCQVIEGIEMFFEQACAQCELWTKKTAPRAAIAEALIKALFTQGSDHAAFVKMVPHEVLPLALARESPKN